MENLPGHNRVVAPIVLCSFAVLAWTTKSTYQKIKDYLNGFGEALIAEVDHILAQAKSSAETKQAHIVALLLPQVENCKSPRLVRERVRMIVQCTRAANKNDPAFSESNVQILRDVEDALTFEETVKRCIQTLELPKVPPQRDLALALLLFEYAQRYPILPLAQAVAPLLPRCIRPNSDPHWSTRETAMAEAIRLAELLVQLQASPHAYPHSEIPVRESKLLTDSRALHAEAKAEAESKEEAKETGAAVGLTYTQADEKAFAHFIDGLDYAQKADRYYTTRAAFAAETHSPDQAAQVRKLDELWERAEFSENDKVAIIEQLATDRCKRLKVVRAEIVRALKAGLEALPPREVRLRIRNVIKATKVPEAKAPNFVAILHNAEQDVVLELTRKRIQNALQNCVADAAQTATSVRTLAEDFAQYNDDIFDLDKQASNIQRLVIAPLQTFKKKDEHEKAAAIIRGATSQAAEDAKVQLLRKLLSDSTLAPDERTRRALALLDTVMDKVPYPEQKAEYEQLQARVLDGVHDMKLQSRIRSRLPDLWKLRAFSLDKQLSLIDEILADRVAAEQDKQETIVEVLSKPAEKLSLPQIKQRIKTIVMAARQKRPETGELLAQCAKEAVDEQAHKQIVKAMQDTTYNLKDKLMAIAHVLADIIDAEVQEESCRRHMGKLVNIAHDHLADDLKEELSDLGPQAVQLAFELQIADQVYLALQDDKLQEPAEVVPRLMLQAMQDSPPAERAAIHARLKAEVLNKAVSSARGALDKRLEELWKQRPLSDEEAIHAIEQLVTASTIGPYQIEKQIPQILLSGTRVLPHGRMRERTHFIVQTCQNKDLHPERVLALKSAAQAAVHEHAASAIKTAFADSSADERTVGKKLQTLWTDFLERIDDPEAREPALTVMDRAAKGMGVHQKKYMVRVGEDAYWVVVLRRACANPTNMAERELLLELQQLLNNSMTGIPTPDRQIRFEFLRDEVCLGVSEEARSATATLLQTAWEGRALSAQEQTVAIESVLGNAELSEEQKIQKIVAIIRQDNENLVPKQVRLKVRMVIQAVQQKKGAGHNQLLEAATDELVEEATVRHAQAVMQDPKLSASEKEARVSALLLEATEGLTPEQQTRVQQRLSRHLGNKLETEDSKGERADLFARAAQKAAKDRELAELIIFLTSPHNPRGEKVARALQHIKAKLRGVKYPEQQGIFAGLKADLLKDTPHEHQAEVSALLDEAWANNKLTPRDKASMLAEVLADSELNEAAKKHAMPPILLYETAGSMPGVMRRHLAEVIRTLFPVESEKDSDNRRSVQAAAEEAEGEAICRALLGLSEDAELEEQTRRVRAKEVVAEATESQPSTVRTKTMEAVLQRVPRTASAEVRKRVDSLVQQALHTLEEEEQVQRLSECLLNERVTEKQRCQETLELLNAMLSGLTYKQKQARVADIRTCVGDFPRARDRAPEDSTRRQAQKRLAAERFDLAWQTRPLSLEDQWHAVDQELHRPDLNESEKRRRVVSVLTNCSEGLKPKELPLRVREVFAAMAVATKKPLADQDVEGFVDEAICECAARRIQAVAQDSTATETAKLDAAVLALNQAAAETAHSSELLDKAVASSAALAAGPLQPAVLRLATAAHNEIKDAGLVSQLVAILDDSKLADSERFTQTQRLLVKYLKDLPYYAQKAKFDKLKRAAVAGMAVPKQPSASEFLDSVWRGRPLTEEELAMQLADVLRESDSHNPTEVQKDLATILGHTAHGLSPRELKQRLKTVKERYQLHVKAKRESNPRLDSLVDTCAETVARDHEAGLVAAIVSNRELDARTKPQQLMALLDEILEGSSGPARDRALAAVLASAQKSLPAEAVPKVAELAAQVATLRKEAEHKAELRGALLADRKDPRDANKLQAAIEESFQRLPYDQRRPAFLKLKQDLLAGIPEGQRKHADDALELAWRRRRVPEAEQPQTLCDLLLLKDAAPAQVKVDIATCFANNLGPSPVPLSLSQLKQRVRMLVEATRKGRDKPLTPVQVQPLEDAAFDLLQEAAARAIHDVAQEGGLSAGEKQQKAAQLLADLCEGQSYDQQLATIDRLVQSFDKAAPGEKQLVELAAAETRKKARYQDLTRAAITLGTKATGEALEPLVTLTLEGERYLGRKERLARLKTELTRGQAAETAQALATAVDAAWKKLLTSEQEQNASVQDVLESKLSQEQKLQELAAILGPTLSARPIKEVKQRVRMLVTAIRPRTRPEDENLLFEFQADFSQHIASHQLLAIQHNPAVAAGDKPGKFADVYEELTLEVPEDQKAAEIQKAAYFFIRDITVEEKPNADQLLAEADQVIRTRECVAEVKSLTAQALPVAERRKRILRALQKPLREPGHYRRKQTLNTIAALAGKDESEANKKQCAAWLEDAWLNRDVPIEEQLQEAQEIAAKPDTPEAERKQELVQVFNLSSDALTPTEFRERTRRLVLQAREEHAKGNPNPPPLGKAFEEAEEEAVCEYAIRRTQAIADKGVQEPEQKAAINQLLAQVVEGLNPENQQRLVAQVMTTVVKSVSPEAKPQLEALAQEVSAAYAPKEPAPPPPPVPVSVPVPVPAPAPAPAPVVPEEDKKAGSPTGKRKQQPENKKRGRKGAKYRPKDKKNEHEENEDEGAAGPKSPREPPAPEEVAVLILQEADKPIAEKKAALSQQLHESSKDLVGPARRERIRATARAIRSKLPESARAAYEQLLQESVDAEQYAEVPAVLTEPNEDKRREVLYSLAAEGTEDLTEQEQTQTIERLKAQSTKDLPAAQQATAIATFEELLLLLQLRRLLLIEGLSAEDRSRDGEPLFKELTKQCGPEEAQAKLAKLQIFLISQLPKELQPLMEQRIVLLINAYRTKQERERELQKSVEEEKSKSLTLTTYKEQFFVEAKAWKAGSPVKNYDDLDAAVAEGRKLLVNGIEVLNITMRKDKKPCDPTRLLPLVGKEVSRYVFKARDIDSRWHTIHEDIAALDQYICESTIEDTLPQQMFTNLPPDKPISDYRWTLKSSDGVTDIYYKLILANPALNVVPLCSDSQHFGKYFILTSCTKNVSAEVYLVHSAQGTIHDYHLALAAAVQDSREYQNQLLPANSPIPHEISFILPQKGPLLQWIMSFDEVPPTEEFTLSGPYVCLPLIS